MSRQRRRAENFTDSLSSFQYTISSDTLNSISQDSLDQVKACRLPFNGSTRNSERSGSYAEDSLILDTSTMPGTPVQSVPDLNKRIDLFQSDSLKDESICNGEFQRSCIKVDNKENKDPQCAIKGNTVSREMDALESTSSKKQKGGINYNIHRKKFDIVSATEKNVLKSTTKSWPTFANCESNSDSDINCEYEAEPAGKKKFERILCSLDNQLNQIKEVSQMESTLKRLSGTFINSPKNFTEKLLTIIEESVINNGEDTCNVTAFNLSRLTSEFRKMCKFIEDESWPEWAPSFPSTPSSCEDATLSPICHKFVDGECRKGKLSESINTASLPSTPLSATDVLRRRFFQKISKNHFNGSADSITNIPTNMSSVESFEHLEAQCKTLFPEEQESPGNLHRSFSMPSLLSMSQLNDICDQQMALLNISDSCNEEKLVSSTPNLCSKCTEQPSINKFDLKGAKAWARSVLSTKESDYKSTDISYSKKKAIKFNRRSDLNNINVDEVTNVYTNFDTDELEKTILQDIAEKRKRCLDTVRLITEINADTEIIEEKKSLGISPELSVLNDSPSTANNEAKFLKTLMSCKNYLTYLERQKPFFNLHEKSYAPNSPSQNKDEIGVKNVEGRNSLKKNSKMELPTPRKSPLNLHGIDHHRSPSSARKNSQDYREKTELLKPKLFFTPGKSPPTTKYKRKKTYFPDMCNSPKNNLEEHILKSPHVKGLYRLNYNTIVSPVGMYIRGTDMQLIKNVRAKTDGLLLKSPKKAIKSPVGRNSKQSTPLNGTAKYEETIPLKLNLSPKVGVNQIHKQEVFANAERGSSNTPKNHMILPKVSYKLPLQVKTIKQTKSPKMGNRVRKLLESTESKVVIRHEGRIKSQRKQQDTGTTPTGEIMEIHYEPEDISIHVEQAASKTNFLHKQKRM
ncbi:uncharacterized protein LOC143352937 [Halictus rubicundus]|uniref:uncharacterized protein LOC143352937 n=1 Tax=Halictus rubicundus TaxID=77578 RepID=UPI0040375233